jgi:hypothetical protein
MAFAKVDGPLLAALRANDFHPASLVAGGKKLQEVTDGGQGQAALQVASTGISRNAFLIKENRHIEPPSWVMA